MQPRERRRSRAVGSAVLGWRAKGLRAALAFLTTLPVRANDLEAEDFARASGWFSVVGAGLGALLWLADGGLRALLPESVAAVALLALWVALTGALHWDGLLDCLDALLAPVAPERRLEILKDVHVGSFALVGGVLLLLGEATMLAALPPERRGWALLLAPTAARWVMSAAQAMWPYARPSGLGTFIRPAPHALLGAALPLLLALLGGLHALATLAAALLLAALLARWMARRLGGGLTGDCYGALCELTQALILLGATTAGDRG